MKRCMVFLTTLLLIGLLTACQDGKADVTIACHDRVTTTVAPTTTTVTTTVPTTIGGQVNRTSEWVNITTSKPYADGAQALLNKNIPWTKPVTVSFYAEIPNKRGQAYEMFFSTADYEFHRSYMADTRFVFDDGREFKQADLQGLVDAGTVTPEQLMALFSLEVYTKQATDTATGAVREGELMSFQAYREATVQQGDSRVHIYPPYDLVGRFYDDPTPKLGGDTRELGYHFNAAYLRQLAEAACPERFFAVLTEAEGIRVGDTLFIPEATAEQYGIGIEVVDRDELDPYSSYALHLTLPEK